MTAYMDFPFYETVRALDKWLLVLLYSYQIYADFFGYSAIAVGLRNPIRIPAAGQLQPALHLCVLFGVLDALAHLPFQLAPHLSVYSSRRQPARRTQNLLESMIVMGLGGLWHGAGLSYLTWGIFHGCLLAIERPFIGLLPNSIALRALRVTVVFLCVSALWIFFKLPDFSHATAYLAGMFTHNKTPNHLQLPYALAALYSAPVIIQHLVPNALLGRITSRAEPYIYGLMAALMYVEAGPNTAFIYFQF